MIDMISKTYLLWYTPRYITKMEYELAELISAKKEWDKKRKKDKEFKERFEFISILYDFGEILKERVQLENEINKLSKNSLLKNGKRKEISTFWDKECWVRVVDDNDQLKNENDIREIHFSDCHKILNKKIEKYKLFLKNFQNQ